MKSYQYIKRSLLYYWRSHLAVLLASAAGTTILVGSLIVGDSVKYSMQQITILSRGKTEYAVETGDRYFQTSLADKMADELKTPASSVLHVQGVVTGKGDRPPVGGLGHHPNRRRRRHRKGPDDVDSAHPCPDAPDRRSVDLRRPLHHESRDTGS